MSTKTTLTIQPPTKTERKAGEVALRLAEEQLSAIERQNIFQEEQFAAFGPLIEGFEADALIAREQAEALAPLQQELLDLELERIKRGGAATPEQLELIAGAAQSAIDKGQGDIEAFQQRSLDQLANELAPSLGLRPSDSPIIDRGGRVAEEGLRLAAGLAEGVRGAEFTARLNFPLAVEELFASQGQFQQNLAAEKEAFRQRLAQQAFANRLNLTRQVGGQGLNLSSIGANPGFLNFDQGRTATTSGIGLGNLLLGTGAVLEGFGAVK